MTFICSLKHFCGHLILIINFSEFSKNAITYDVELLVTQWLIKSCFFRRMFEFHLTISYLKLKDLCWKFHLWNISTVFFSMVFYRSGTTWKYCQYPIFIQVSGCWYLQWKMATGNTADVTCWPANGDCLKRNCHGGRFVRR